MVAPAASTPQRSVSSSRPGQKFTSFPPSTIKSANSTAVGNATNYIQVPSNTSVQVSITSNALTTGVPSVSRTIASIAIARSTVVSWAVIWPSTTTLTTHAETTLSSPNAITLTNSSNGQQFVSTPAFLTVWRTSTDSWGAMVTFTQIAANPLANLNETSSSFDRPGFLHNQGEVAGAFAAIGLVATAIIAFLVLFADRYRRLNRRKRLAGMQQQRPDPFAGPPSIGSLSAPMMHNSENNDAHRRRGISPLSIDHDPFASGNGKFGSAGRSTFGGGSYVSEQNVSQAAYFDGTGLATNKLRDANHNEQGTETTPPLERPVVTPPPRPPRSMHRRSAARLLNYLPTTPPEYTPSDSNSSPSSLKSSPIFDRRTILDVRARPTKSDGRNN